MTKNVDTVIIGGGVSGLAAAITLRKKGLEVLLLEKKSVLGGAATSFKYKEFILDYGPHGFHTDQENLLDDFFYYVKKDNVIKRHKSSQIYYKDNYYNYPLRMIDLIKNMNLFSIIHAGFSFAYHRLIKLAGFSKDSSAKSWIINRYGRYLYNEFFGPYTHRVWGVEPSELASDFAQDRIPDRNLIEILKSLIFPSYSIKKEKTVSGRTAQHDVDVFYYPKKGIRQLIDGMEKSYKDLGGNFNTNCSISKIIDKNDGFKIDFRTNGINSLIETRKIISTIPITSFFSCYDVNNKSIKVNLNNLKIRSLVFLYILLDRNDILPVQWVYYHDKKFNRISEVTKFSKYCAPESKSALCIEISCFNDDEIYHSSDKEIYNHLIDELLDLKFFNKDEIIGYCTKREKNAYVVYMKTYREDVSKINGFIEDIPNVYFAGRQGMFKYINMDQAMQSGINVANESLK